MNEGEQMFGAKKNLSTILLTAWFVVSLLAFLLIGWNFLQASVYESGLRSGASNASAQIYTDIINKAANDECNTVFVQFDGRRVDLINVVCLQRLQQQLQQQNAPQTAPTENQG
ncbi:hypothetical protein HIMB100_00000840 [SAR116 cluster alpha proteobacterium HIMB100]|nr:hypothetical protein HIMB100_00000840 [SAR116 cluster alpha proteobacterium HIMB100]